MMLPYQFLKFEDLAAPKNVSFIKAKCTVISIAMQPIVLSKNGSIVLESQLNYSSIPRWIALWQMRWTV